MSAAVVPGAKFLAWTMCGPTAEPLMDNPGPVGAGLDVCVEGSMLACVELFTADAILLVLAICAAAEEGLEGGLGVMKGLFLCGLTFVLELDRCDQV